MKISSKRYQLNKLLNRKEIQAVPERNMDNKPSMSFRNDDGYV